MKFLYLCAILFLGSSISYGGDRSYSDIDIYKSTPPEIIPHVESIVTDAKKGDSQAQFLLSYIYSKGIGVEKSPKKSREWLIKSAEKGFPLANYHLGQIYLFSNKNRIDVKKALDSFIKAANQGHHESQQIVGSIFYGMYGAKYKDIKKSIYYLDAASISGNGSSSFILSCIYRYDLGDKKKFIDYINLSIDQKSRHAIKYGATFDDEYHQAQCKSLRNIR